MNRVIGSVFWIIVPFLSLLLLSCEDESNIIDDPGDIVFPDTLVSFKQHVQPLLNISCARSGCHDGKGESVPPNLTYYEGVRFGPPTGLIDPGKPQSSILIITIKNGHGYQQLTRNHIEGIEQWILEGAENN